VGEIREEGFEAAYHICNITKEEEVVSLMDFAVKTYGALNIVIANAGIIRDGLMIQTDEEGKVKKIMSLSQFQSVLDVNLTGCFLTLREGAVRMVNNKWEGLLLIVSSINKTGQVGQLNYSSTKASVALWPKILSGEFHMKGIHHIRIVGIAPGYVATPILKNMNQKALDTILKDVHIQRLIEPEEITGLMKVAAENDALDATTLEITGGVLYGNRTIAK